MVFALYFGNRGFFPESLIASAREELCHALKKAGHDYIMIKDGALKYGAVETTSDGLIYAQFLKENEGKFDGAILSLPNFGDENGAVAAFRDCKTPILIQAFPDEIGKMNFESRRDAFCGKFSIMDMFCQYGIKFTAFKPQTVNPSSSVFAKQLEDFAAVCRTVKAAKRFSIGAIGARTTAFKTVRYDELALQANGITVEAFDLLELRQRMNSQKDTNSIEEKANILRNYTGFRNSPAGKLDILTKMCLSIEDMVKDYRLDSIALRCWNELQAEFGVAPCVLLSYLNDNGLAAACELDICNAAVMHALSNASQTASACLDWNNNYSDDEDKCILFHCGSTAQSLMAKKGDVTDHKMFAKSYGAGCGYGCNEGRIGEFPFTYASMKTQNGNLYTYIGHGEFTNDPIEEGFFGCGGVAKIKNLQDILLYVGKNGYRHHVSATRGDYYEAIVEAFENYLGYEVKSFG